MIQFHAISIIDQLRSISTIGFGIKVVIILLISGLSPPEDFIFIFALKQVLFTSMVEISNISHQFKFDVLYHVANWAHKVQGCTPQSKNCTYLIVFVFRLFHNITKFCHQDDCMGLVWDILKFPLVQVQEIMIYVPLDSVHAGEYAQTKSEPKKVIKPWLSSWFMSARVFVINFCW